MRELLLGIVLIILIGVGGFFYRNAMERGPVSPTGPVACTMEAKVCPDGAAVGRQGPSCEFAPCPPPNAELNTTPDMTVVVPPGYIENKNPNVDMAAGGDMTIVHEFRKPASSGVFHTLTVHQLGVDAGDREPLDAENNIVRETVFYPADMPAESIDQFEQITLGGRTFYVVVIERFEAIVHSAYYLPVKTSSGNLNLYSFEVVEHDVTGWMDAHLHVRDLPEHSALEQMLETLQSIP